MVRAQRTWNRRLLARLLGMMLIVLAASMAVPIMVSLYYGDGSQYGFMLSGVVILMLGLFLRNILGASASYELHARESFFYTAIVWVVVPLMGALPYIFTSSVSTFTDAAFESFSGFTTTGSSVLVRLDKVPQGLLVWRSTSQWVGGLGLMLFIIAILHRISEGSARLYEAEFSGTLQRRLHPRMKRNVLLMWVIYIALTLALFLLLLVDGNGFVDSYCTALSTVSTGGFMTHSDGMAGFSSFSLSMVTLFMFLSGINLALLFSLVTFRPKAMWADEELPRYVAIFFIAVALSVASFVLAGERWGKAIPFSLFHVASTLSTCGFYTTPPSSWPTTVSVVTFLLIFVGASAGSTGGGMKIKRLMIMFREVRNYFVRMIHPHAVLSVKINGKVVAPDYVVRVFSFLFLYLVSVTAGAFVLTLCGINIPNAFCMAAANLGNLGPSPVINNLGASLDYVGLLPAGKWAMVTLMLAGRLEIFALVAVFMPAYWRRR